MPSIADERTHITRQVVEDLRRNAIYMRSDALRLEALADKIENPPEGVRVEYDGKNTVRFVGPTVETLRV